MDEFCPISPLFLRKRDNYIVRERSRTAFFARLLSRYLTFFLELCENLPVVTVRVAFADAVSFVKLFESDPCPGAIIQEHCF